MQNKWLKRWSPVISIIAIFISVVSVGLTYWIYTETTRPHTQFAELHDRLNALDNRINRAEQWIEERKEHGVNVSYEIDKLEEAKLRREEAWKQWDEYNFDEADKSIKAAHEALDQILQPPLAAGLKLMLILIVSGVTLLLLFIVILFLRHLRRDKK